MLIRRAQVADVLPGDYKVNAGQDIMISVYNIHRSPQVLALSHYCVKFLVTGLIESSTFYSKEFIMLGRIFIYLLWIHS